MSWKWTKWELKSREPTLEHANACIEELRGRVFKALSELRPLLA